MDIEKAACYLLYDRCFYDIERLTYDIIEDSEEDPQYSAVTAANCIKAYITVRNSFENKSEPLNVVAFLRNEIHLSDEEIAKFERIRIKESEYYIGEIF